MNRLVGVLLILGGFRAVAADKKEDAIKDAVEKLQGTYRCVSLETDGMKGDADRIEKLKLVVKDKKWTVYVESIRPSPGKGLQHTGLRNRMREPRVTTDVDWSLSQIVCQVKSLFAVLIPCGVDHWASRDRSA